MGPKGRLPVWKSMGVAAACGALLFAVPVTAQSRAAPEQVSTYDVYYETGPVTFSIDDIIGDSSGITEGSAGDVVIGNDAGEDTTGNIVNPQTGSILYPIDSAFTFDVLDFYGATDRPRDGVAEEGWAGPVSADVAGVGLLDGVEFANVETSRFKSGAPLGTWAAGLGEYSAVKASTELFTVMESVLTCYQTHPYDFWDSYEDWAAGNDPVPKRTADALAALGLSCLELTDPHDLETLDGLPGDLMALIPNESLIIEDMLVDPENDYSVTKKDDGKLLFRWGGAVKRPTDIRFQKTLPLPAEWMTVPADEKGFVVTRAELILRHNITNNPNDQIRPEDWENEAAKGLLPDFIVDSSGNWVSTVGCYEGDGDYIPAGTIFKLPTGSDPTVPAADLKNGNTPAWYTTIERDPFQWAYDTGTDLVGSKHPDPTLGDLITGPRWRMTSNKFGQNLPGLEIPAETCAPPPYQKGENRYDVGEFETTVINLLDWNADEPRWDDAVSPLAYSAGWTHDWATAEVPGQEVHADDASRCHATDGAGNCVTELGTTLTDGFDVTFYVKGDQKPLRLYDVALVLEYESETPPPVELDPFVLLDPVRVFDSRSGIGLVQEAWDGLSRIAGDMSVEIPIDSLTSVPLDADAVAVNLTVTDPSAAGWLAVHECGSGDPSVSSLNFGAGDTVAAMAVAPLNGSGGFCVYSSTTTNLIVDVVGFAPAGGGYVAGSPLRIADTRPGAPAAAGEVLEITPPASTADAFAVTLTAADPAADGFLSVVDCATGTPNSSTVNYRAGQSASNMSIVDNAAICVYTSSGTDVLVDVHGHFEVPITMHDTRALDTRPDPKPGAGSTITLDPATVPALATTSVAAVNVTATEAFAPGYATIWSCADPMPATSNINYTTRGSVANMAVVDTTGPVCVYVSSPVDVIVDLIASLS
ncbi:MAG: hypothetical protein ACR2O6_11790 [Ilumatobacteraceae bacterium]